MKRPELIAKLTIAISHIEFAMSQISIKDPLIQADSILSDILKDIIIAPVEE